MNTETLRLHGAAAAFSLSSEFVLPVLRETPQSVVLFDDESRRMVHADLKDAAETCYPVDRFEAAVHGYHLTVMTNATFSRPRLSQAKAAGANIATDLQTASESSRTYDADFFGLPASSS